LAIEGGKEMKLIIIAAVTFLASTAAGVAGRLVLMPPKVQVAAEPGGADSLAHREGTTGTETAGEFGAGIGVVSTEGTTPHGEGTEGSAAGTPSSVPGVSSEPLASSPASRDRTPEGMEFVELSQI